MQSMDALMGIAFWHLHERNDCRATKHRDNDSAFKSDLAVSSQEIRVLTDAAYALKHGRLTRGDRMVRSVSQVTEGPNVVGVFRVGDFVGGNVIYLDLPNGKAAARDIIIEANRFLRQFVDSLST